MTIDELLDGPFLIACRSVGDYRKGGARIQTGFAIRECAICKARVAVSPQGIEQSGCGGVLVCNLCAFNIASRLQAAGRNVELFENEAAREGLDRILARLGMKGGTHER